MYFGFRNMDLTHSNQELLVNFNIDIQKMLVNFNIVIHKSVILCKSHAHQSCYSINMTFFFILFTWVTSSPGSLWTGMNEQAPPQVLFSRTIYQSCADIFLFHDTSSMSCIFSFHHPLLFVTLNLFTILFQVFSRYWMFSYVLMVFFFLMFLIFKTIRKLS